jgi:hypothetical protein
MRRTAFLLVVILAGAFLASPAAAQRGGRGGGGGGGGRRGGSDTDSDPAKVVMPQPVNAVNLLIMHIRDLALSDSQVKRIVAIKRNVDSTNTPLLRRLDSLQTVLHQRGVPTALIGDSVGDPRVRMQQTAMIIRTNIQPARAAAYALLAPEQLDKAMAYEDAAQQKFDEQERAALAAGTKRGGG